MKKTILTIAASATLVSGASAATPVVFEFDTSSNAINGDLTLADAHDDAIDGETTATVFSLESILSGLTITITPSQNDISYTGSGLGINTGGTLSASADALIFSFNRAITFDFLDVGSFTDGGNDAVSLSYSNSNPTVSLASGEFDNNTSDTIDFTSDNALAANESFTISRDSGSFSIEGFNVTVVPEPSSTILLGLGGLALILRRRL